MKMITINGKTYSRAEMDYNMLCDLEDMGISISEIKGKSMSFIRAYIAKCMGEDAETAGKELNQHFINGGSIEGIMDVIKEVIDESGFFQALGKAKEEANTTDKSEKK